MKEIIVKSFFILSIVLTVYSCDDNVSDDSESLFTIHASEIQGFSGDRYVMATSPLTGEVLFWDVMTSFEDNITFDANNSETVDLTYASEFNSGFNITTYRDIKSEFKLSKFLYPCFEGQFDIDTLSNKFVDIILPGTKEIIEIVNPAYDNSTLQNTGNTITDEQNKIIYDLDNDITIINAYLGTAIFDHQFVFRFSGEQDYKSIVINREDWVKVDNDNYMRILEIEDLSSCSLHEIDLGIDATWIVESEVFTTSGDEIKIADWSNYSQNQTSKTIRIFLQDNLEIEQLTVKIKKNNINEGYQLQKNFENIPTSISLVEHNNEVTNLTPDSFNYSNDENFDLIKTSYKYVNNNQISSWDIFQSSSSDPNYKLPEIEEDFLNGTAFMKPSLMNPISLLIHSYSLEKDVDQIYHETGIDRQLQCLDFNSSYDSYEF